MKSEFLMLAHTFDPDKHRIGNWMLSEKLDGMRAFWDGGITRGMLKNDVPWANTTKDSRYKKPVYSTGLWSRYAHPIQAPDSWLDKLPRIPLDGELWIKRGEHQELMSIVKDMEPGFGWPKVKYYCFDIPDLSTVFEDRLIDTTNFKKSFKDIMSFLQPRFKNLWLTGSQNNIFKNVYAILGKQLLNNPIAIRHNQLPLPSEHEYALERAELELQKITMEGGEGVIIRSPISVWIPERSHTLLKMKKLEDDEAVVVGYVSGKGKLLGLFGSLILDYHGKRFELSGFTDEERELKNPEWAYEYPGYELPEDNEAVKFPRGTVVTFTYRELSKDRIPKEARYMRKREN